jgi:hypothetical protein
MTQQFTANEVRACKKARASVSGTGAAQEILHAFADMLEAQEKAGPVATVRWHPKHGFNWRDVGSGLHGDLHTGWIDVPLYTHPAPSDAERLAEALRDDEHEWPASLNIRDTKLHDDMGGPGQRIYTTAGRGYKTMKYIRHDLAHSAQAQPPAARVTDEMVMRLKRALPLLCADVQTRMLRAALEAALAAQENHNG